MRANVIVHIWNLFILYVERRSCGQQRGAVAMDQDNELSDRDIVENKLERLYDLKLEKIQKQREKIAEVKKDAL